MRSLEEVDGPWPHNMTITSSVNERLPLELLFLRGLLQIPASVNIPGVLNEPHHIAVVIPPALQQRWATEWQGRWDQMLAWQLNLEALKADGHFEDIFDLAGPPPRWSEAFESDFFNNKEFEKWEESLPRYSGEDVPLEESPEWQSLGPLRSAWESGLTHLFVLPFVGKHARRLGEGSLMISHQIYVEPAAFSAALAIYAAE